MIIGLDVSHWQGVMDWAKAASAGAQFAFLKAGGCGTDGINYVDKQWADNILEAPTWMPCGSYWYFQPNKSTPAAQADYYCAIIKDKPLFLPPVIDIETNGGIGAVAVKDKVKNFAYRIKANLGQFPMIYTRSTFWNPSVGDSELWEILDLWIARYTTASHPWGSSSTLKPRDWSTYQFWQFSADNNGRGAEFGAKSASIDIDYFNGSFEDLQKRYRTGANAANPGINNVTVSSYGKEGDNWYINLSLSLS